MPLSRSTRRALATLLCFSLALPALPAAAVAAGGKPKARPSVASRIVSLARHELGVREIPDGSNRAPGIRRYETATRGAMFGAPWCAYFVSYVARRAGAPIGPGGAGMGYVPYIRAWAKQTRRWTRTPHAGDLITFPEHVGIVETVYRNHTLTTIEGNAGNAVRRRWRHWGEAMGYVRVASGPAPAPSAAPAPARVTPQRRPGAKKAPAQPLVARITAYPGTTIAPGQVVSFTSNDSAGDIVRSAWDFDGNGSYDAGGDSVDKRYTSPGTYHVRLRVTDSAKRTATTEATITVRSNRAPVAVLDVSSDQLTVGDKLTANAGRSTDPDGRIVRYDWDLNGDGEWSQDGKRHTYTFDEPGDYSPGLRVTDDAGNVTETHVAIHVADAPAPVARVTCDTTTVVSGHSVRCRADDSASPVKLPKHDWDLDADGADDRHGTDVRVAFTAPGEHVLRLRVTDERGRSDEATVIITVTNQPPVARIGAPDDIGLGERTAFDGTDSSDPDGEVVAWEWDLDGDGSYETSGREPSFTYAAPGTYTVGLRVTDDHGATAITTAEITVVDAPSKAVIALPQHALINTDLVFDAGGSTDPDSDIVAWAWDLDGDGSYEAAGRRPTFRYATTGRRTIRLRITDEFGATATASATLTVGR